MLPDELGLDMSTSMIIYGWGRGMSGGRPEPESHYHGLRYSIFVFRTYFFTIGLRKCASGGGGSQWCGEKE